MEWYVFKLSTFPEGASELAQFPVVLYVLFLLVLFPLLNLVGLLVAATTQYLATNDLAAKAATQADYTSSLNSMLNEAAQFQSTGLSKFVQLEPAGGYVGCGDDLYVLATDIGSGVVISSSADQPITQTIDTSKSMYELQVQSTYSVSPLTNLAAIPFLGNVPGLGQPATLSFTANRPVEHPGGLQATATSGGGGGGSGAWRGTVTPFPRVTSNPATSAPPTPITWRDPGIYAQIQDAGQSIISQNVFIVDPNNGN